MSSRLFFTLFSLGILVSFAGCQPNNPGVYLNDPVVEISVDGEKVLGTGTQACIDNPDCNTNNAYCNGSNGGPTDIVRNKDKVVAVLCYPDTTKEQDVIQADGSKLGKIDGNNRVVTFGPATDGKPLEGDVSLEGNNNVLYGNGTGNTVIVGDVRFNGNNGRTRSLTIRGNLTLEGNTYGVVRVVVEGNLIVKGNNSVLADVVVFGDLTIEGNNHSLLLVHVGGNHQFKGSGFACTDVYRFKDENKDALFQRAERGDALQCP